MSFETVVRELDSSQRAMSNDMKFLRTRDLSSRKKKEVGSLVEEGCEEVATTEEKRSPQMPLDMSISQPLPSRLRVSGDNLDGLHDDYGTGTRSMIVHFRPLPIYHRPYLWLTHLQCQTQIKGGVWRRRSENKRHRTALSRV